MAAEADEGPVEDPEATNRVAFRGAVVDADHTYCIRLCAQAYDTFGGHAAETGLIARAVWGDLHPANAYSKSRGGCP